MGPCPSLATPSPWPALAGSRGAPSPRARDADPTTSSHRTQLTTESPLWVGAWWVGFLGAGAAAFLVAVPILAYPRQLPGGCPPECASGPRPRSAEQHRRVQVSGGSATLQGAAGQRCACPTPRPGRSWLQWGTGAPFLVSLAPGCATSSVPPLATVVHPHAFCPTGVPDLAGAGPPAGLWSPPLTDVPVLPGSQRYVVMRASETYQLKDSGDKAASSPDFGKTIRDLPL